MLFLLYIEHMGLVDAVFEVYEKCIKHNNWSLLRYFTFKKNFWYKFSILKVLALVIIKSITMKRKPRTDSIMIVAMDAS